MRVIAPRANAGGGEGFGAGAQARRKGANKESHRARKTTGMQPAKPKPSLHVQMHVAEQTLRYAARRAIGRIQLHAITAQGAIGFCEIFLQGTGGFPRAGRLGLQGDVINIVPKRPKAGSVRPWAPRTRWATAPYTRTNLLPPQASITKLRAWGRRQGRAPLQCGSRCVHSTSSSRKGEPRWRPLVTALALWKPQCERPWWPLPRANRGAAPRTNAGGLACESTSKP